MFKMHLSIFILFSILICVVQSASLNFCNGQQKVPIRETSNKTEVEKIYNDHGVYFGSIVKHRKNVCSSIDGKSNRIYGDVICRYAIPKLKPGANIQQRTRCDRHTVQTPEKEGKPEQNNNQRSYKMARCVYGPSEVDDYFFILPGPQKHYYYIFIKNNLMPESVIQIIPQKNDLLPLVKKEVTTDKFVADDIFGVYGRIPRKKLGKAICLSKKPDPKELVEWCHKALASPSVNTDDPQLQIEASCARYPVQRQIWDRMSETFKTTSSIQMLKCAYIQDKRPTHFVMFHGPDKNLIYTGKILQNFQQAIPAVVEITGCVNITV